ncbi:hypothetical membrane protein [Syntrophus aciditrophicus SB]|uniref:Hypothetical membrane protein n=1 Tax=Syntrophus aciditrophicus (strain SB) TaxID=56780 RepID=Q2LTC2_SYNAS|nr:hypothetical membrane protein [Syntrophus aciditrophicus SB]
MPDPLFWRVNSERQLFSPFNAVLLPQAIVIALLSCLKTGIVAFFNLDIPDDVLLGTPNPCIDSPLLGYLSYLLNFHPFSPFCGFLICRVQMPLITCRIQKNSIYFIIKALCKVADIH